MVAYVKKAWRFARLHGVTEAYLMSCVYFIVICIVPTLAASEFELAEAISKKDLENYRFPIDSRFREAWMSFYTASSEVDDITTLVAEGPEIAPSIAAAIKDKKLFKRRYAILALGYLKSAFALDTLRSLVSDKTEEDVFRSDALYSLYRTDEATGIRYARMLIQEAGRMRVGPITMDSAKEIIERPRDIQMTWMIRSGP